MGNASSSNSSGDIKMNHKYSLSAPSSTKKNHHRIKNASPSPDIINVAHPETNILDMEPDSDKNIMGILSKDEQNEFDAMNNHKIDNVAAGDIAKALVDDVIQTVISL